jgi:hypothetical protein
MPKSLFYPLISGTVQARRRLPFILELLLSQTLKSWDTFVQSHRGRHRHEKTNGRTGEHWEGPPEDKGDGGRPTFAFGTGTDSDNTHRDGGVLTISPCVGVGLIGLPRFHHPFVWQFTHLPYLVHIQRPGRRIDSDYSAQISQFP